MVIFTSGNCPGLLYLSLPRCFLAQQQKLGSLKDVWLLSSEWQRNPSDIKTSARKQVGSFKQPAVFDGRAFLLSIGRQWYMKDSGASIFCPCLCTEGSTKASINSNRGKIRSAWEKISDSLHPHLPTGQQSTFRTLHHSTCDLLKAAAELWCRLTPSCIVSRRTLKGHPRSSC